MVAFLGNVHARLKRGLSIGAPLAADGGFEFGIRGRQRASRLVYFLYFADALRKAADNTHLPSSAIWEIEGHGK